jgi:tol-pal system protein YbgF
MRRLLLFVLLVGVALPGCVIDRTGQSGSYLLRSKLDVTRERTRDLEGDLLAERARIDTIEERAAQARRQYADSGASVQALMEDLTYLRGQVSDLQHNLDENGQLTTDLEFQLMTMEVRLMHIEGELSEKVPDYEMAPMMFDEPVLEPEVEEEPTAEVADEPVGEALAVLQPEPEVELEVEPEVEPEAEPVEPEMSEEEAMFQSALVLFQDGSWKRAGGRLQAFLDKHPDSQWWLEAQYLVGQCLFELGRHKSAITEFQQVIVRDERSPWAARAMLMQAVSFEALGTPEDIDAARVFYSEVMSLYPDTEEATRAKAALGGLGGG